MSACSGLMRACRRLLLAACLVAASASPARAQSASGSIEGTAIDQAGAVLRGVEIILRQPALALERRLATDGTGAFRAPLLPVGTYELTASLQGFQTRRYTDLPLTVGQTMTLVIEMRVAHAESVVVSGAAPVLDTSRGHVSATVDRHAIENLPVNGRNFIDFVLLTSGVTRDGRAGDLSFAGQRGTLNSLIVDGADNNHTFAGQTLGRTGSGRAPYQFSLEAVREFRIAANSYSAEHGRAGGVVINVVTRSGSNDVHGAVFEFYRDKALNARDAISVLEGRPKRPYHYHQFGGTAGGRLRRDRDFFFASYDGQRNRQSNQVVLNLPASTPADDATRAAVERLRALAFDWDQRLDQDVFLFRTDHKMGTAGNRLTLRYNHQDFTGVGYEQGGPQNTFEHTGASRVRTKTLNAGWATVWRDRVFNELRLQYARDDEPGEANSDRPEATIRQGGTPVLTIGRNNFSPRHTIIDRVQIADTATWSHGAHQLKTGFDLQFDRIDTYFPAFFSGSYRFDSLASFHQGRPASYQQNFPGPGTDGARSTPDVSEYSFFVQDDWRARHDLTLNLGLRYDLMTIKAPPVRNPHPELDAAGIDTSRLSPDRNNWGPRVGVSWRPHGRSYVVRGGSGVFYGRTPAMMVTAAHTNNGVNIVSLTFTGTEAPTYPDRFHEIPAGVSVRPNIVYLDADFRSPRLLHANAGFEWELGRDASLAVTYLFVDGASLSRAIDRNLGSATERIVTIGGSGETVRTPFFGADRRFAGFARVLSLESTAESRYNGLTLDLNRRHRNGLQLRVAYTLGKVVDTAPDATAVLLGNPGSDAAHASNPLDFEIDRAPGDNDQRHRIVASGVYTTRRSGSGSTAPQRSLASGWTVSAVFSAGSGRPYSARIVGDLNGDGNPFNDRAPGTRRNERRLPALLTLDTRVARDVPVPRLRTQLIWEAFNLLNRDNISFVRPSMYELAGTTLVPDPLFGRPLSSTGGRIMQLAARVSF